MGDNRGQALLSCRSLAVGSLMLGALAVSVLAYPCRDT